MEELQAIAPENALLTTLDSAIDSSETDSASKDEEVGLPEPLTSYFSIEHQELSEKELEEVVKSEMLRVKKEFSTSNILALERATTIFQSDSPV